MEKIDLGEGTRAGAHEGRVMIVQQGDRKDDLIILSPEIARALYAWLGNVLTVKGKE